MSDPVKFLWDDSDKRVKRLDIPEQSGLAKVHEVFLKKEALKKSRRGTKNGKNRS